MECKSGTFISFCDGASMNDTRTGLGIATGASCSQCGLSLCGTCVFGHLARFCENPLLRIGMACTVSCTSSPECQCGTQCEAPPDALRRAAWFADPSCLAKDAHAREYVVTDADGEPVIDMATLESRLDRSEEHRVAWALWAKCVATSLVHECSKCGVISVTTVHEARVSGRVACLGCRHEACARCGKPECDTVPSCAAGAVRLALLDDESSGTWAPAHRIENAIHAALRTLERGASASALADVFRARGITADELCAIRNVSRIVPRLASDATGVVDAAAHLLTRIPE